MNPFPIDVSVVIPTRNRPRLLLRAVESALAQTARTIEVIVVVDGEDAATVAAMQKLDDTRLTVVALSESVGGSEARNVGVRASHGRYIALLDDDDEWRPDKLAAQLVLANAHTVPNFVVTTQYVYRSPGEPDEIWPGHLPSTDEPLSEFLFSSRGGFQTSTYLCPRDLFLANPFKIGLRKHQDWDWFLRLASLPGFELLVVRQPLSVYWVPLRSRSSISGSLDWRFSAAWAKSCRSLMTPRAYATFLVKMPLRAAGIQREKIAALRHLLPQILFVGRPTLHILGELLLCVLVPERMRLWLRRLLLKRTRQQSSTAVCLSPHISKT